MNIISRLLRLWRRPHCPNCRSSKWTPTEICPSCSFNYSLVLKVAELITSTPSPFVELSKRELPRNLPFGPITFRGIGGTQEVEE